MDYFLLKLSHIVSSTILFGTGIGTAFSMFMANRQGNIQGIYTATRNAVLADWLFTTPSGLVQVITGAALVMAGGYDLREDWILWGIGLYVFAGLCWLPVVWLQLKMRDMAKQSMDRGEALPPVYWRMDKWWIVLGCCAFPALVIVFYLMVVKPAEIF